MATPTSIRPFRYSTRAAVWPARESVATSRSAIAIPTMYLFIVHPFLLRGPSTGSAGGGTGPSSEVGPTHSRSTRHARGAAAVSNSLPTIPLWDYSSLPCLGKRLKNQERCPL